MRSTVQLLFVLTEFWGEPNHRVRIFAALLLGVPVLFFQAGFVRSEELQLDPIKQIVADWKSRRSLLMKTVHYRLAGERTWPRRIGSTR